MFMIRIFCGCAETSSAIIPAVTAPRMIETHERMSNQCGIVPSFPVLALINEVYAANAFASRWFQPLAFDCLIYFLQDWTFRPVIATATPRKITDGLSDRRELSNLAIKFGNMRER